MKKTNKGLVKFVKKQLNRPYWYGCFGQISSRDLYKTKKRQYPVQYQWECKNNQPGVIPAIQLGVPVFDCIGLIKAYLWSENGKIDYNPEQDVSANGMLSHCKKHGNISTMPDIPGVLVFMKGHVGVYIGNGKVIEARGHKYGVVKTNLKARKWEKWGFCPWIEYLNNETQNDTKTTYFKQYNGDSISIVDALDNIGEKTDFKYRTKIAKINGIKKYIGLPSQNLTLLNLLKNGKLIKPEG